MDEPARQFPIVNFVLTALITKSASENPTFSRAERALFVACTFWASVARRRLAAHLGSEAGARLRAASAAFAGIGAARIAAALNAAVAQLPQSPSPVWLQERAEALEAQLLDAGELIDDLIAKFVSDHMCADSSAARRARVGRPRRFDQDLC